MKTKEGRMTNAIHWNKKTQVANRRSAWHDHATFEVPFTGKYDHDAVSSALRGRVTRNFVSNMGGQVLLGDVSLVGPGVLSVEMLYAIGN
jgi:hypothetical protein